MAMFWTIKNYFNKYNRVMRKVNKFYDKPKEEELWNLDSSIAHYLIPRLKKFINDSNEIVDWHYHELEDNIDVIAILKEIITKLEYIEAHRWVFDEETAKKSIQYAEEAFELLGKVYFYLWW